MSDQLIGSIAIIGGGPAGWMAAATLSRVLRGRATIQVVDGGETADLLATEIATLPALRSLHEIMGIDEADLLRRTGGTFRLGTQFEDWSATGRSYFHPLGEVGANLNGTPFRNHWLKLRAAGEVPAFAEFSVAGIAAQAGKFARPATDKRSVLSTLDYGYHLDTRLYTEYLRALAERGGVTRISDTVQGATVHGQTGYVDSVVLRGGQSLTAGLYIDCTGILVDDTLKIGFEDWSAWLPCDRVVCVAMDAPADLPPYSRAVARDAGWQWFVPLRDRAGNGYVYSSADMSDEAARASLLANLGGDSRGETSQFAFRSGRRSALRHKNVVALGPAAGRLEPLEGAPLHLIQIGITRLLSLFPDRSHSAIEAAEYNRIVGGEFERLRDFLILHYKATSRSDTPFWRRFRDMDVPEPLDRKLTQFESRGRVVLYDEETFAEPSWASVLIGQDIVPRRIDPYIDTFDVDLLKSQAQRVRSVIRQGADSMPAHRAFLDKFCAPR